MPLKDMELRVENLTVSRGGLPVLEGVCFALSRGQALVLRGPNGVGKTTLLRTIAGLQPPIAGNVICAEDSIAYGAHADGLKSMLSVGENLTFWADVFGQRGIDGALAAYDLTPLRDRMVGTLSAGQKRRTGLARLLVTGRTHWVLDEPTVSLDHDAVAQFRAALSAHLSTGGTALLSSHIDLGISADLLDLTPFRADLTRYQGARDEAFL